MWEDQITYEKRDDIQLCPDCGKPHSYRKPPAPAVFRHAYHDGVRRAGFADIKEAAKLELDALDLPPSERAAVRQEIRKVKSIKK
jgi:hypothetical protein